MLTGLAGSRNYPSGQETENSGRLSGRDHGQTEDRQTSRVLSTLFMTVVDEEIEIKFLSTVFSMQMHVLMHVTYSFCHQPNVDAISAEKKIISQDRT